VLFFIQNINWIVSKIHRNRIDFLDKTTKFCSACGEGSLDFIQAENLNWLNCDQCNRNFHLFCVIYDNSIEKKPDIYCCLVCNDNEIEID
jgi:hypothetical protein